MTILFNTKLRKKLLAYSFTHPDEEYYVRELAGIIDVDVGNLSRELRKFKKEGLYKSSLRGSLKIYALNKNYPLFKEVKDIIFKTVGVEGALKQLISSYKDISFAFIYGSYAKNTEKKTSDIDLVLVGRFPLDRLTNQIRKLESRLGREINFNYYSEENFRNEKNKKDSFLNIIFKNKIIILKGKSNNG